ncbi:hypothetical protein HDU67_009993 [Dinochytrium kinnereticum]|nr:hypothetical protein HDU67_009993 [Dinochytrium kinnereticum]
MALAPCEYKTGRTLGQGSYATVKEAIQIKSGERFAVKVISKKLMQGREHMILNEIEILKKVSKGHKNIVTLHDLYLVMDLCTGGELFDRICEKGSFYEEDAAEIVRTVVDAVGYLHEQNIVHRDIKPENLLFRSKDSLSELVIADFGLSKIMDPETYDGLMTTCGTPGYMAPEVIKKTGHGRAVDLWSIGVLSYFLLCGYTPFDSNSSADELQRILTGSYSFEPTEYWKEVSSTAKEFIRSLLIVEAADRLTAKQALKHQWLAQLDPMPTEDGQQPTRVRTVDLLPNVKARFDAKRMFKKAIGVVKAINKLAQSPNVSQENLAISSSAMSVDESGQYRPREDEITSDGNLMMAGEDVRPSPPPSNPSDVSEPAHASQAALVQAFIGDVPVVVDGMVPLKDILGKMIQQSFANLQNMSETWGKVAEDVQKLQDACFVLVADGLARIHAEMKGARDQSYDIVTAIDVLTTGRYRRLPSIIKKELVGPLPLTKKDIMGTVKFIEQSLAMRVLFHEVVPLAFRESMTIENGCVLFRVKDEFEISLTVGGTEDEFIWEVNSLDILVRSGVSEFDDVTRLKDDQKSSIFDKVRQFLRSGRKELLTKNILGSRRPRTSWPLVALYDYLHLICLNLQLEILKIQETISLSRTRWKDKIMTKFEKSPSPSLSIHFWTGGQSTVSANYLEIAIKSSTSADSLYGDSLSLLEAYTIGDLAGPAHFILARIFSRDPLSNKETKFDDGAELGYSASSLDVESLLVAAAERKGRDVMMALHKEILGVLNSPGSGGDWLNEIELVENSDSLPSITILYRPNHSIRLDFDIRSGKIVISYSELISLVSTQPSGESEGGRTIIDKIKVIEDTINKDPACAGLALLNLRRVILISQIDVFGAYLGLDCIKAAQLDSSAKSILGVESMEHVAIFGFPNENFGVFIAVAVCRDPCKQNGSASSEDFYRVWFIKIGRAESGVLFLTSASPLPITATSMEGDLKRDIGEDCRWDRMDLDALSSVVLLCRKQLALTKLLNELKHSSIKYSYIFQRSDHALEVDEGSIASKDPLILIRSSALLEAYTKKHGDHLCSMQDTNFDPFVGVFISIQHFRVIEPEGQAVPAAQDLARGIQGLSSFRATAKMRLRPKLLPLISLDFSDNSMSYDKETAVLTFQLELESKAINTLLKTLLRMAIISRFAMQINLRQRWCLQNSISVISFDLFKLNIELNNNSKHPTAMLSIFCEAKGSGEEEKVLDDLVQVRYSLQDSGVEPSFTAGLNRLLEKYLSAQFNVVSLLERVSSLSPLVSSLRDLEVRKSGMKHVVESGSIPLVRIYAKGNMCLRLEYGLYGVDFHFLKGGLVGLFDAFYASDSEKVQLKPVEYFSDITETLITFPHLVGQISEILVSSEASQNATVLALPHGVVFSPNLLLPVFDRIERHLENIALLYFIHQKALELPDFDRIQFQPNNLRIMFSVPIGVGGLIGSTSGAWKVKLVLRDREPNQNPSVPPPPSFRIGQEDLNILVEKINTLKPESGDHRAVLSSMIDFIVLPHIALNDLAQITKLERSSLTKTPIWRLEWCLNVPEGSPSYLPPVRSPATIIERDKGRISLVFRFSRPGSTDPPYILPLRFNYVSKIVGLWRAPDQDRLDLTLLPADSHTEAELVRLSNSPTFGHLPYIERVLLQASSRDMPVEKGGPGKLFIIAKALSLRPNLTQ